MFVKQGKGAMSTQMWEGVVHPCNLPAQDMPGAGYPRCCVSTQSCVLPGSPEHQDRGYPLRGLEWQNPILETPPSCSVLHWLHC